MNTETSSKLFRVGRVWLLHEERNRYLLLNNAPELGDVLTDSKGNNPRRIVGVGYVISDTPGVRLITLTFEPKITPDPSDN